MGPIMQRLALVVLLAEVMAAPTRPQQGTEPEFIDFSVGDRCLLLLSNKGVQEELKASEAQASKMTSLAEEELQKRRAVLSALVHRSPKERALVMLEHQRRTDAEVQRRLTKILEPAQLKRFNQVCTQSLSISAFLIPRVQAALQLSDQQKARILRIVGDLEAKVKEECSQVKGNNPDERLAVVKKMMDAAKSAEASILALLSDEQKATWKDLTGDPYLFKF